MHRPFHRVFGCSAVAIAGGMLWGLIECMALWRARLVRVH